MKSLISIALLSQDNQHHRDNMITLNREESVEETKTLRESPKINRLEAGKNDCAETYNT